MDGGSKLDADHRKPPSTEGWMEEEGTELQLKVTQLREEICQLREAGTKLRADGVL